MVYNCNLSDMHIERLYEGDDMMDKQERDYWLVAQGRRMLKPLWTQFRHEGTGQGRGEISPVLDYTYNCSEQAIALPPPDMNALPSKTFVECAENRKSIRKYSEESLSVDELSFLLWETAKIKKQVENWTRRPIPSAGGRHCLKTYLYIERVEGSARGIYVYLPDAHELRLVSDEEGIKDKLCKALCDQDFDSAVIFLWAAVPGIMEYRYSTVAHKMIAMEAGHICQNLHLAAEAIDCGCCAISAYYQADVDELVRVDGEEEFVIYAAMIGKKRE